MQFTVQPAGVHQAQQIAEVHVASWRTTYRGIVPDAALRALDVQARTAYWSGLLEALPPHTFIRLVLDDPGQVVRFAAAGPARSPDLQADAELYAIYLAENCQRQGAGKALFAQMTHLLRNDGFASLGLWVLARNPSRAFYEALGGVVVAESSLEMDGVPLAEVAYRWKHMPLLVTADE